MPEIEKLKKHVREVLGIDLLPKVWGGENRLPIFLSKQYVFYEVFIMDTPCILMVGRNMAGETPAVIRKHVDLVVQASGTQRIIYVQSAVAPHDRKRLIEQRVSFIIPGNQLYLPLLGIDLRENYRKLSAPPRKHLSPSAQVVLLHALYAQSETPMTQQALSELYGYSVMAVSRAFDEIVSSELAKVVPAARRHELVLRGSPAEVWKSASGLLRSPVKKQNRLDSLEQPITGVWAGLTALSAYSMLAAPKIPVVAVVDAPRGRGRERYWLNSCAGVSYEGTEADVQEWIYNPCFFAKDGIADRLSLFLALRESGDERVDASLEEMMEDFQWRM